TVTWGWGNHDLLADLGNNAVLDVTMGEDACPIYRGDAAEILACIRHMALNMLRGETSRKASIRRKQKIAGMSSEYLEAVLTAGIQKLTAS
ncbi:transposase, partial [Aeromonas salmonicida]|uniref:transposase n=1 Tax=Aeromonas salmonicida TaxID=645 RepID=UPI003BF5D6F7